MASSLSDASTSTMRLSTSKTSMLYFFIQVTKLAQKQEKNTNRSKVNKIDQNRSNTFAYIIKIFYLRGKKTHGEKMDYDGADDNFY